MEQEDIVVTIEAFDGTVLEIENIPIENAKKKPMYLDVDLISELREAINSSPIFWKDDKYHSFYNQVCAVMDRLGTAVDYVNKHRYYPKSEEKFICFMAFACMIVDAPKLLAKKINEFISEQGVSEEHKVILPYKKDKVLFKDICTNSPFNMTEQECPTDNEFFEFFRSITFAHPYNTNKLFKKLGNQVSPWVNVHSRLGPLIGLKGYIGITMYSDLKDENNNSNHNIRVSFNDLKKYIKLRYENLKLITQWVESEILRNKGIWKAQGIVKGQTPIETLCNIKQALTNQFQDTYEIDDCISYLTCNLTYSSNSDNVQKFRRALIDRVDTIYQYAAELDYSGLCEEMEITYTRPKIMHQHSYYQLEKIFCYLNDNCDYGNIIWGRQQAHEFSKGFAKKWVTIDAENMSFEEIKLLVTTACYLEHEEQEAAK